MTLRSPTSRFGRRRRDHEHRPALLVLASDADREDVLLAVVGALVVVPRLRIEEVRDHAPGVHRMGVHALLVELVRAREVLEPARPRTGPTP